jgi:hypothetical protein
MNRMAWCTNGNPGSEPLTFPAFNINPEDVTAELRGAPAKNQEPSPARGFF